MKTISREQVLVACEALGIDPNESHSITIEPTRVSITRQIFVAGPGGGDDE